MEDVVGNLVNAREDSYTLEKGYEICVKARRKKESETLYDFINKRVHPKSRKKLINMIESYTDAMLEITSTNNKIIYKTGFHDCMQLILAALSN